MLTSIRKIARLVGCVLLLAMSFGSVSAAAELGEKVLCLGGAGHAAVEFSVGAKCSEFAGETAAASTATKAGAHCGPCLDVSLSSAEATSTQGLYNRSWLTQLPSPNAIEIVATNPVVAELTTAVFPPLVSQLPLSSTLRDRRTVVLQV